MNVLLPGVSRAKILDYALPVSRVKQIYSSGTLFSSFSSLSISYVSYTFYQHFNIMMFINFPILQNNYLSGEVPEENEMKLYEVVQEFARSLSRDESTTLSNAMRHMVRNSFLLISQRFFIQYCKN